MRTIEEGSGQQWMATRVYANVRNKTNVLKGQWKNIFFPLFYNNARNPCLMAIRIGLILIDKDFDVKMNVLVRKQFLGWKDL